MKICLGCNQPMQDVDFKSIDLDGSPDIHDNIFTLKSIKNNSCDVILASHVLEHGPYYGTCAERVLQVISVLKLWFLKMEDNGNIYIAVPNFDFIAIYYLQHRDAFWQQDIDIAGPLLGGGSNDHDQHKMIFNQPLLTHVMQMAGFVDIQEVALASSAFLPEFNRASMDSRGFSMMGTKKHDS